MDDDVYIPMCLLDKKNSEIVKGKACPILFFFYIAKVVSNWSKFLDNMFKGMSKMLPRKYLFLKWNEFSL